MSPFVEDVQIPKAPKMTLTTAVKRLRGAGYKGSFRFVTLRRPLGPKKINTLYLFTLTNGHNIAVDTVTGKVSNRNGDPVAGAIRNISVVYLRSGPAGPTFSSPPSRRS